MNIDTIGNVSAVIAAIAAVLTLLYMILRDRPKLRIDNLQIWLPSKDKVGKIMVDVINEGGRPLYKCQAYAIVNNRIYKLYSWTDFEGEPHRDESRLKPFKIFDLPPGAKKTLISFLMIPIPKEASIEVTVEYGRSKIRKLFTSEEVKRIKQY